MKKFVTIALAALALVSCNYKEETWINFMDYRKQQEAISRYSTRA